MPSIFNSFAGDAMQFLAQGLGEDGVVTPKGGAPVALVGKIIVLRDRLNTRTAEKAGGGGGRLEYELAVQIPVADYPGTPNLGGDTVAIAVRYGDSQKSTKRVASLIGQVGGMWHLGLS